MNGVGLQKKFREQRWAVAVFFGALLAALALTLIPGSAMALICPPGETCIIHSAPDVTVENSAVTVNEGTQATNSGTFDDTADDDSDTVDITASVGEVNQIGTDSGTWSWTFTPTNGPADTQTVTITASDSTGRSSTTSFTLNVNNVAPSTTITSGSTTIEEGAGYYHSLTDFGPSWTQMPVAVVYHYTTFDPGADTVKTMPNCGEHAMLGGQELGSWFSCSIGDGPNTTTVSATSTDSDSATGNTATRLVTITNVNPTAMLEAPDSVEEGSAATVSLTRSDDISMDDFSAGFHYAFDCNGGSLDSATYANKEGSTNSTTCTYQSAGTKTIRARIIDKDDGFSEYTRSIQVNPATPVDTTAPTVEKWKPTGTRVSPTANVIATFSEAMDEASVEATNASGLPTTFTLKKKGTTKTLGATVVYSEPTATTFRAVLNPSKNLKAGATYIATITSAATDLAGNPLVAKPWKFTVKG